MGGDLSGSNQQDLDPAIHYIFFYVMAPGGLYLFYLHHSLQSLLIYLCILDTQWNYMLWIILVLGCLWPGALIAIEIWDISLST